jgi:hypothetical protein
MDECRNHQFLEQLERQMQRRIEELVSPSPVCASMLAQIANLQRNEARLRSWGFVFPKQNRIQEESQ